MICLHDSVQCINEYELIRKYRCCACEAVMMCACDREVGERFLSHQLRQGCILDTQERVPVTFGFVEGMCRECRGLPPEAHPLAAIPGRTHKIQRFYWREIQFETFRRFAARAEAAGFVPNSPLPSEAAQALRMTVAREVLDEFKQLHTTNPKYDLAEPSQEQVLAQHKVEHVRLDATFAPKSEGKRAGMVDGDEIVTAEEFVARHYRRAGWRTIFVESVPFHVLFGIYMWILIQDADDPNTRMVSFGSRSDYEGARVGIRIETLLPVDFGTPGYALRRVDAIDAHLANGLHGGLERLFDRWLVNSQDFRQYLWAHREPDVERARQIIGILPRDVIVRILRYLVGDYWRRYVGWPDLLVYRDDDFFFAEVKASKDKLSADQKRWIADNAADLHLPFKLAKIHRAATAAP